MGAVSNWWSGSKPQDNPGLIFNYIIKINIWSDFVLELDLEKVMSPEEKKKLYDAIGYEGEDTSSSTYPEEVSLYDLY